MVGISCSDLATWRYDGCARRLLAGLGWGGASGLACIGRCRRRAMGDWIRLERRRGSFLGVDGGAEGREWFTCDGMLYGLCFLSTNVAVYVRYVASVMLTVFCNKRRGCVPSAEWEDTKESKLKTKQVCSTLKLAR